jgi:hypothetical protein
MRPDFQKQVSPADLITGLTSSPYPSLEDSVKSKSIPSASPQAAPHDLSLSGKSESEKFKLTDDGHGLVCLGCKDEIPNSRAAARSHVCQPEAIAQ